MTQPAEIGNFIALFERSIRENWDLNALTDYEGATLQYKDLARKIEKVHILLEHAGVKAGDRIAICGRNCSHWGVAFLATLTYGAVAVPVLHEFTPEQVHNIVNHSESRLLFAGDQTWPALSPDAMPVLEGVVNLADFSLYVSRSEALTEARAKLNALFGAKYPMNFRKEHVSYKRPEHEDLALINYTSGTTSFSKGVMIPYRAVWSNVAFGIEVLGAQMERGSRVVSILPMAHMYGMAFEFLFEVCRGCHIHFLTRMPTPQVIFKAFQDIRPNIVITVPLIIEKVVRKVVMPKLEQPSVKMMLKLPFVNQKVRDKVRTSLIEAFGGQFAELIIGGAALNSDVEQLLKSIDFPFTVGYGATECAPIISYINHQAFRLGCCGKAAPRMEIKIDSPDPQHVVGQILTRGTNVMLGYYKNPEATAEVLDAEGWYYTGDLGLLDADGYLYIKGRSKNMLLGPSGQNIYPEEIESALSSLELVAESVVIQRNDKLIALVYVDPEEVKVRQLTPEQVTEVLERNRKELNASQPNYAQVTRVVQWPTEFEKTPKKSIKRFLYQDAKV
ncbi:MAG: AMP-binding protein [Bacteroidales bacterium]|nr:AMP-binding protein [Bacteroidales bacterium]